MKVTLSFDDDADACHLWGSAYDNFTQEQPSRFIPMGKSKYTFRDFKETDKLYFCETFLEAKF
jgi:hypothetical protein